MPSVNWDPTRLPLLDTANLFNAPESSRPREQTFGVHLQGRPTAPSAPLVNPSQRSAPPAPPPVDNSRREPNAPNPSPAKEHEASSALAASTPPPSDTNERTENEDQEPARAAKEEQPAERTADDSASQDGVAQSESAEQAAVADKSVGALETARKLKAKLATASNKRKSAPAATDAAATNHAGTPEGAQEKEARQAIDPLSNASIELPVEDPSTESADATEPQVAAAEVARTTDTTAPEWSVAIPVPIAVDTTPIAGETPVESVNEERGGRRGRQAVQTSAAPGQPSAATAFDASVPGIPAGGPAVSPEASAAEQLIEATHGAAIGQTGSDGAKGTATPSVPVGAQQRFAQHLAARAHERPASAGPTLTEMEQARIIDRVARAFRTAESREGTITLRLHPPELGVLRVELQVREGVLSAHLEAETPAARTVLLDNVHLLRDRLAEQGVRIERFDVDLLDQRPTPDGSPFEQPRHQDQPHSRGAPIASGGIEPSDAETPRPVPRPLPGQLNVII